ncbi:MAG: cytochrome oxidase Cu insertion factor (SCO1/SenC/PrrC family) [Cocleimonas sp.]|jgi:cytochrome oxidase Cu insertion factor (SCO1/SenC/PrrC family)
MMRLLNISSISKRKSDSNTLKYLSISLLLIVLLLQLNTSLYAQQNKPTIGGDFTLTDHNSERFELQQLRGKLVMAFFGYTHCPDICPTKLATMAKLLKQLGKESDKISSLFISVGPERDTPEKLKNYVPFFSPHLIGLTGTKDEIDKVTKAYRVQTKIHSRKENSDYYLVDHSANLYVIDGQGKLIHLIPFGLPTEHILNVLKT